MQIFSDIRSLQLSGPTLLTIGNFDGFHRGHQMLLQRLRELATGDTWKPNPQPQVGLVTFDPHPLAVLRPNSQLQLLTTPRERVTIAAGHGLDFGIIIPFTPEVAQLRAVEFMTLLKQNYGLTDLVVGPDFALGHGRSGNIDRLRELGTELGYRLTIIDPIVHGEKSVRSSVIRQLLGAGQVAEAADLLGRLYSATGVVIEGDKLGRTIGSPTANLATISDKLLPLDGVYATRTALCHASGQIDERHIYWSVTNLGVRPTVNGRQHRFETHLLDFPRPDHSDNPSDDLYGQTLRVEFVARLRGEEAFSGIDALKAQIQADIARARQILLASTTI